MVRAFRLFDGFRGENPRAWLLAIVRNCAWTFLQRRRDDEFDEELHGEPSAETPEVVALRSARHRLLNQAVDALPVEYCEVFILREAEGLSYKEIAEVAQVPIGTVMSRLSRARRQLEGFAASSAA